jgi:hypothetical protein
VTAQQSTERQVQDQNQVDGLEELFQLDSVEHVFCRTCQPLTKVGDPVVCACGVVRKRQDRHWRDVPPKVRCPECVAAYPIHYKEYHHNV